MSMCPGVGTRMHEALGCSRLLYGRGFATTVTFASTRVTKLLMPRLFHRYSILYATRRPSPARAMYL